MFEISCDSHNDILWQITLLVIVENRITRKTLDGFRGAENWSAKGRITIESLGK